jgi:trk system potassium uptake protein
VQRAAAVLTISLFAVVTATLLLLLTHDVSLDIALFEVVSAFATCGLTLAFTTELSGFGLGLICLMMLWGRLGALTVFLALAQVMQAPQPVTYPEEQVLIG